MVKPDFHFFFYFPVTRQKIKKIFMSSNQVRRGKPPTQFGLKISNAIRT